MVNKYYTKEKENDVKRCAEILSLHWSMQNNKMDKKTKFIYNIETLAELDKYLDEIKATPSIKNCAYHRWFNFVVSKAYEEAFASCGAVPVENEKDNEKDFSINNVNYDLKVTVKSNKCDSLDLDTEEGKISYIRWMYDNQSRQQRYHTKNRLFVVCTGEDTREQYRNKANITENIKKVEYYVKNFKPMAVKLNNGQTVYSDIIVVK